MSRLLLISPYDGPSHRYWRVSLGAYLEDARPDWRVHHLTMPPRHFSWRQRGNSLGFAMHPDLQQSFDLVIATSITDLSALRGMNRHLSVTPTIVYYHENEFAYPDTHATGLVERQMTSLYTAISADRVCFNSDWNRRSFLAGAEELLERLPDEVPAGVAESIRANSQVLPVALEPLSPAFRSSAGVRRIAWNHRWEHDKGPEILLEIVEGLLASDTRFEMSLFGEQFRRQPETLARIVERLSAAGCLRHAGYVSDRDAYLSMLGEHDMVLSTARQEFQGLAVQEAMQLGCIPVVPDALSYPEYVPSDLRYGSVSRAIELLSSPLPAVPDTLSDYAWARVGPAWLALIDSLLAD